MLQIETPLPWKSKLNCERRECVEQKLEEKRTEESFVSKVKDAKYDAVGEPGFGGEQDDGNACVYCEGAERSGHSIPRGCSQSDACWLCLMVRGEGLHLALSI